MDQLSLTQVLPVDPSSAPQLWELLRRHPELVWGHGAPDLEVGARFGGPGSWGPRHEGVVEEVTDRSVRFGWSRAGWSAPAVLALGVVEANDDASGGARLVLSGAGLPADEVAAASEHWESVLAGIARFVGSANPAVEAPVRAVLFDADGVLQMPSHGWLDRLAQIGGPEFVRAAFAAEAECLTGTEDFGDRLAPLLQGTGASVEDALQIWFDIVPDPEALALVDRLRGAGIVCGLATNQQSRRGGFMQERMEINAHFDRLYYSYEVGHAKPSGEYFQAIVDDLGLPAQDVAFVDDVAANVIGAREAGLRATLHRPGSGAAELAENLRAIGVPA